MPYNAPLSIGQGKTYQANPAAHPTGHQRGGVELLRGCKTTGSDGVAYFRLFRRVHVAPGVTVNLAKTGPSLSLGVRGAHITASKTGIRKTVGLPGSGCFYTSKSGWHSGVHTAPHFTSATAAPPPQRSGWQMAGHALLVLLEGIGIVIVAAFGILLIFAGTGKRR